MRYAGYMALGKFVLQEVLLVRNMWTCGVDEVGGEVVTILCVV